MPVFSYTTMVRGRRQQGDIIAHSAKDAVRMLRDENKIVLQIQEDAQKTLKAQKKEAAAHKPRVIDAFEDLSISKVQLEMSLRQLASMLKAGVPILVALKSISTNSKGVLAKRVDKVAESVRQGNTLSSSMRKDLSCVGNITIGLLSIGEANGTLDNMAKYTADLMERSRLIRNSIISAFAFPFLTLLVAMGVGYFIVNHVLPTVIKFIDERGAGVALPWPTKLLLVVNDFVMDYGVYAIITPFILIVLFFYLKSRDDTGLVVDRALLDIPLIGGGFRFYSNTMWALTLGALLESGLDVVSSIDLIRGVMSNKHYELQFNRVRALLRKGKSLSKGFEQTTLKSLSPMAYTMLAVSEESGGMSESLETVAKFDEYRLNKRVALLSKVFEVGILVCVALMVALVIFGFYLAMMTLNNSI